MMMRWDTKYTEDTKGETGARRTGSKLHAGYAGLVNAVQVGRTKSATGMHSWIHSINCVNKGASFT